jgi:hypothetical protein
VWAVGKKGGDLNKHRPFTLQFPSVPPQMPTLPHQCPTHTRSWHTLAGDVCGGGARAEAVHTAHKIGGRQIPFLARRDVVRICKFYHETSERVGMSEKAENEISAVGRKNQKNTQTSPSKIRHLFCQPIPQEARLRGFEQELDDLRCLVQISSAPMPAALWLFVVLFSTAGFLLWRWRQRRARRNTAVRRCPNEHCTRCNAYEAVAAAVRGSLEKLQFFFSVFVLCIPK